jgi:hypothetical protein
MDTKELARRLPDVPRWLETRSMLLNGTGEVVGTSDGGFVAADAEDGLICVFGRPRAEDTREAVSGMPEARAVVSAPEDRDHVAETLPDYEPVRAVLHLPGGDGLRLPEVPEEAVRLVEPGEVEDSLEKVPDELRRELRVAVRRSPVAAVLFEDAPVSFCYAAARTETLWDVSIDTVEGFRRLGLAAMCVSHMVGVMGAEGLAPVWGAEVNNAASLALAGKLGFVPVDEMVVFHPRRGEPGTP